jgi:hypothetical protein
VRWTFEGEARWMLWLFLLLPALAVLVALVIPWLRGS